MPAQRLTADRKASVVTSLPPGFGVPKQRRSDSVLASAAMTPAPPRGLAAPQRPPPLVKGRSDSVMVTGGARAPPPAAAPTRDRAKTVERAPAAATPPPPSQHPQLIAARKGSQLTGMLHKFNFEKQMKAKPGAAAYRLQGDASWDEDERMKKKREAAARGDKLQKACLQFWRALGKGPDELMSKDEYIYVHRRVTKALAPELSEEEAEEAAEDDWEEDLGDAEAMTAPRAPWAPSRRAATVGGRWSRSIRSLRGRRRRKRCRRVPGWDRA